MLNIAECSALKLSQKTFRRQAEKDFAVPWRLTAGKGSEARTDEWGQVIDEVRRIGYIDLLK
jgi:hypothetical protein